MIIERTGRWKFIILCVLFLPLFGKSTTVSNVTNGYWFNPNVWSTGVLPKGCDTIQVNHIIGSDSTIVVFKTVLEVGLGGALYSTERIYRPWGNIN
ncbi:MAG: hypothetical protein MK078_11785 [Crocinitomicaceae bacterium]|nr:hypothetical protein [Crocinitomicaceae bacterium]